ncbi:putative bifunctional diguanylate cyclase/phosphodiesterase [Halomonas sp. BC04]|uniref:putative bifunctional diguanylate cyclase/phosphodiesterase n=1 Tax=Halomonas sp. BC04 TaxID=1403540 RepID=UPI0003ED8184|nr:EAL domain-containing protein [Halomonas sp. BC04]EWG99223.1 diguanylate cyclase [Halomonas sp. BC04]
MNNHDAKQDDSVPNGGTAVRRWLHRLVEPAFLFTLVGFLVLAVIWGTTLNLVAMERASADRTARALAADTADTYEAQMVRALREIDTTLRLVRHSLDGRPAETVLEELRARDMLPPELLFTISVVDSGGNVIASTPEATPSQQNVADDDYFLRAHEEEGMVVGLPRRNGETGEWQLFFSRQAHAQDEGMTVIVVAAVHAGYFVSSYAPDVLGDEGVLALLGNDGIFRIKRTGDEVITGTTVDYSAVVANNGAMGGPATVRVNPWDETRRYTVARELFEFPLAIVVGLSEAEHLAAAQESERTYLWYATLASLLLLAFIALLGRLSWMLHRSQSRIMDERIAHARRVEYLAFHDNLTGLPNRAYFTRLLTQGMQQSRRYGKRLALLFLDLDRFKAINDSLGHDAGDELLQEVGLRLNGSVRESDIVARLGGDEFVILLPEITDPSQVTVVADKILDAVSLPFTLVGQEFRVTVSIGIALFPQDGEDEQTLMKHADVAMYHAKAQGKNNAQFYSEKLSVDSLERLALESSMRKALENEEFRLFYQSKQDMITGRVTGMEALLRWQHPDLGLIAPMQFIPLAEENGLIVAIGRWVFNSACRQNVEWQAQGFPPLSMAVNLSARQFLDDHLLQDIKSALEETGMAPELLELEITESMMMVDMPRTVRILKDLKGMGVRIAIDDFGTGYSSLSKLKEFPLDTIKIDGSFIQDLVNSAEDRSLTEAIIELGKSLSLTVVAEGVESIEQADYLRAHSCDQFQGFYINMPMPAAEFELAIRQQIRRFEEANPTD